MGRIAKILFILIAILSSISCREEIIAPDNIAGNINEPVKVNSATSYSFLINAESVTNNVTDPSPFIALKMSCYVTIVDYVSGSVQIIVSGKYNYILFSQMFNDNINSFADLLEGNSPEYIQLKFVNFTGKLRFELNKL